MDEQTITVSEEEVVDVFAMWERQQRDTPAIRMPDDQRLNMTPEDYGRQCAEYFIGVLKALRTPTVSTRAVDSATGG